MKFRPSLVVSLALFSILVACSKPSTEPEPIPSAPVSYPIVKPAENSKESKEVEDAVSEVTGNPIVKFDKPTDDKGLNDETGIMFGNTWTDSFSAEYIKFTVAFFDRGLQINERNFPEKMIRIDWKDPADVHKYVHLHDSETLIYNYGTGEVILKPWQYWIKISSGR